MGCDIYLLIRDAKPSNSFLGDALFFFKIFYDFALEISFGTNFHSLITLGKYSNMFSLHTVKVSLERVAK